jgi:hypothetical protein
MRMPEEQNAELGTQNITEPPAGEEDKDQNQTPTEGAGEDKSSEKGELDTKEESTETEETGETKEAEVPESYEFPEDLGLNDEEKGKYTELLKKHNASQEAANEVIEILKEQSVKMKEASVKAWYDQVKKWGDEAAKHEEYGGQDFQKNIDSVIMPVINKFGDPKLVEELDKTGFGNNPRLLGMFYKIGKELGIEAEFVEGKPGGLGETQSIAEIMYPTMYKKKE